MMTAISPLVKISYKLILRLVVYSNPQQVIRRLRPQYLFHEYVGGRFEVSKEKSKSLDFFETLQI